MALVVTGRLNKQIAYDLGISEVTVKARRSQVMRKMNAASLPHLARMADKLNLTTESVGTVKPCMSSICPSDVYHTADSLPPIPIHLKPILAEDRSAA
jgi:DNA-binding CsgD family transcriptional regulator